MTATMIRANGTTSAGLRNGRLLPLESSFTNESLQPVHNGRLKGSEVRRGASPQTRS